MSEKMSLPCKHCQNGWFHDSRYGTDVECVNGVLIDIDVYTEGWAPDVLYPVAPCHPMWGRQQAGDEGFKNDSLERLESYAGDAALVSEPSQS
jgi:hypothetical protein